MTSIISNNLELAHDGLAAEQDAPRWPIWVEDLIRGVRPKIMRDRTSSSILTIIDTARHRLVRARVPGAATLSDAAFAGAAAGAYVQIAQALQPEPVRHAVRFWNYIPDIHRACAGGIDRYMVFNTGRFEACRHWQAAGVLPTASGVGHAGDDLIIDALATDAAGLPIENPRQRPSYDYSRRYGPNPPCFSRATLIPAHNGEPPRLLVGGTASVVDEESMHVGNLIAQLDETLLNLASLIAAAANPAAKGEKLDELRRFTDLRVYRPRPADDQHIDRIIETHFRGARVERMTAPLCRSELLVEIEGVAVLKGKR